MNNLNAEIIDKISCKQHLVETLQEERSAVWALYCRIAEMKPSFCEQTIKPMLSEFSQLLIDYVSLGHFGIYEHLLAEKQYPSPALSYAEQIYPVFSSTTASAVSFNDAYESGKRNFKPDNLERDLSLLGERLAERMELEDRLCSMLLH